MKDIFRPTVLLALALMAVIAMMILPMPAWLLDLGLAVSFGLAILVFTVTLFIERPLDFSAFPTILLASLMLRLSLNVSSTKLIISEGHGGTDAAGDVIAGFANFIMGGGIFLGLVVFGVLLIVNFMVITKGAGRMAEVGARFALDGMPGRQLAIDSDMAAGAIDHEEAKTRRKLEQDETTFFGSLDGASKFVKGDAVAGLLITLLNLVVGLAMGVAVHDMPIAVAFETYSVLTVGDGLVTQFPAVIISIAAAILLSRGGSQGTTDLAILSQLGRYPSALGTVAVLMGLFAFVPGLPFLPFIAGAATLAGVAYLSSKRHAADEEDVRPEPAGEIDQQTSIGDTLDLDDVHIEFAPDLVQLVLDPIEGLEPRINGIRRHVALEYGLLLPEIRLTDNASLESGAYRVIIHGVEHGRNALSVGKRLVLLSDELNIPDGEDVREPVYGAPARWLPTNDAEEAILEGATVVGPTEVLATHLLETIKSNLPRLLTLKNLRRLFDALSSVADQERASANRRLIEEYVPDKISTELLLSVLRSLLEEQVSIRNLPLILDAVAEHVGTSSSAAAIVEHVRQRLGFQIAEKLRRDDGSLPLIQLDQSWETVFQRYQTEDHGRQTNEVSLPPNYISALGAGIARKVADLNMKGDTPAIVTSQLRRKLVSAIARAKDLSTPVISFEEIGFDMKPAIVGVVEAASIEP